MKKSLSIILALVLALSLTACDTSPETSPETSGANSSDTSSDISEPVVSGDSSPESNNSDTPAPVLTDLPRMDGSTSATPLEIGLRSGFQGIPYNEAKELVSHTTTHDSFKRLINGEVDLIFSVPISDEQKKMADEAGVKLFMEPVAREGFVFVVNKSNPINSLTQEQLRKIYSGEITNWSQVGGKDEKIIPYQRNLDSGSQNYMTVFMGDTPLLPAKKEFIAVGMGGLMDAIAVYDNSAGAIGYSVYSYAAQMYANADKVKFIAIDGVEPSKATMADESYPLLSCTYMIYTDKSPDSAKKFVEKALSDEGQKYVLDSGYLPVNGMKVPEKYLPYDAVGTGEPKPADFKPCDKYSSLYLDVRSRSLPGQAIIKNDEYFEFDFLKDTALQDRINSDVRAAMDRLRGYELTKEEAKFREDHSWDNSESLDNMSIKAYCRNGYLSMIIGYFDRTDFYMTDQYICYNVETLNYDLFSGKKIERYSDLFYKGEDFLADVNDQFSINSELFDSIKKLDFYGILGEPRLFTIDGVILEPDNIYFGFAPMLCYNDCFRFHSPVTQYRDMKPLVYDKYAYEYDNKVEDVSYDNEWEEAYVEENGDVYLRYVGSPFHTEAEVKAKDELWYKLQKRAWDSFREVIPDWHSNTEIRMWKNDKFYSVDHFSAAAGEEPEGLFDIDTLELITIEDLVGENWRDYLSGNSKDYTGTKALISGWGDDYAEEGVVDVYCLGEGNYYYLTLKVPAEKMNKRYYTPKNS